MNTLDERCHAYEAVAKAIRFIREHVYEQPGLEEIAAAVGLSPFHLQRTFGVWAGISPKRFLQSLTKEYAVTLLRQSQDVLSTTFATGLSSPGRLHDLMIQCDAVTPGEVRTLGKGLEIRYGFGPTPLGRAIAAITPRGLCHFAFVDDDNAAINALEEDWPNATLLHDDAALAPAIGNLFPPHGQAKPLHLLLRGTNFQIKVWEALIRIPRGELVSYRTLAGMVGNPRAQRAVGTALAQNRIALLIPCHRVIRENGMIGQYRWGSERKSALLALESVAVSSDDQA